MAHRKHHKKHKVHRRRSVGALSLSPRSPLVTIGSLAAGWFLSDEINAQILNILPASFATPATPAPAPGISSIFTMQGVPALAEVGIGTYLLMKKRKSLVTTIAGGISAGAGLKVLLKKAGMITGYQSVPVVGRRRMAGYQSTPVIGGNTPAQLQGIPAQLEGFRVNGYDSQGSGVMGGINNSSGITSDAGGSYMN